jgi:hypothetical protein
MDPNQPFQEGIPAAIRETPTAQSPIPAATPTEAPIEPSKDVRIFVANVEFFYKWLSTWLLGICALAPVAMAFVPTLQGVIPPNWERAIYSGLAVLTFVARIAHQETSKEKT